MRNQHMQRAFALHQSGQLALAESVYREVLKQTPDDFDCLHLLGVLLCQTGRFEASIDLLTKAAKLNKRDPVPHYNLGLALEGFGRTREALDSYDRALKLKPDYVAALNNRGNVLQSLGRLEEAIRTYDRALTLKPDFAESLNNRGNALRSVGKNAEALASYEAALKAKPDFAQALNNRGNALRDMARYEEALESYDRALRCKPDYAEAARNRGLVLSDLRRYAEAIASFDRALAIKPHYPEALNDRGNALRALKRPSDALASYEQALALEPGSLVAMNNRGAALLDLKRPADALHCFERVIEIHPSSAEALNNRGMALKDLKRPHDALASFASALEIKPDYAGAHVNEGLCRLLIGDFLRGWEKNEWRWQIDPHKPWKRDFAQPLWRGTDSIARKTVLLHAEQGFGDNIQFCRYAPLVAMKGATVLLEVPGALKHLMSSLADVAVIERGERLPEFDYHCPLVSLPLAFGTTLESIPRHTPYLSADAARVDHWRERVGTRSGSRIGIAWSGNMLSDPARAIPLAQFTTLFPPGVQVVSLQKDVLPRDQAALAASDIIHFGSELRDFADTAALIELMDIVVTIDTSAAHLAGALGQRVWILLPFVPDWRWMLEREDSPWYPTARLFRQRTIGEWSDVIRLARSELEREL